jgi:hypothetical protein
MDRVHALSNCKLSVTALLHGIARKQSDGCGHAMDGRRVVYRIPRGQLPRSSFWDKGEPAKRGDPAKINPLLTERERRVLGS